MSAAASACAVLVLAFRGTEPPRAPVQAKASMSLNLNVHAAPRQERDEQLAGLLRLAAGGDARAFELFYSGTVRCAMALVRRIVGDAYAEDVLSDSYFQAWRHASQYDPARGSAVTWLLTLTRSRALDRLRQETLRHGGITGAPAFEPGQEPAHEAGPEQLLEGVQARSCLHAALAQLSATERWVLGLAYYRDLTQTEIASATGLPLGTVKSLASRAQRKLREALQNPNAPAKAAEHG
jgi:RNA polymerase sigma-70 factor (ECF subfamily)